MRLQQRDSHEAAVSVLLFLVLLSGKPDSAARILSAMPTQQYFFKLIPPRPTFPHDMNDDERHLMDEHERYFEEQFEAGRLLLYGPVFATSGSFGLAILEVYSEAEARQFGEADPSVRAGLNRFEIHPMRVSAARAKQP